MARSRRPKTVFILGAGFSYAAGIPMQGELLTNILNYDLNSGIGEEEGLEVCRKELLEFIEHVYGLTGEQAVKIDLEDIYTPIHKCTRNNEFLKGYSPEKLRKIEVCLNRLIAHVINHGKMNFPKRDFKYVYKFAKHLLEDKIAAPTTDHFSIISLNWDILLDKRIFEVIEGERCIVDYCCHITGIDQKENRLMPPLVARALKNSTIKIMKLHGSLNWVKCPQCHRLYANKTKKEAIKSFLGTEKCKRCGVQLEATFILPTFQKDLAQFHYQMIWNQAAIELSEATKLVFIGYSFPLADFDFRSMITKYVKDDVEIEVVGSYKPKSECDPPIGKTENNYRNFFGDKITAVYNNGAADYIENHLEKFGKAAYKEPKLI